MRGGLLAWAASALSLGGGAALLRALSDRVAVEGGAGLPRLRRRVCPPFQILIYHRVHPSPGPFMLDAVPPARFEAQMRHLARCWRVLPLSELATRSADGTVPPRAVAITFDDGYADNCEHAFPILRRLGLPATVFVVTGCIGTGVVPWHDRVLLAFQATRRAATRLPGEGLERSFTDLGARRSTAFAALASLKRLPELDRLAAVDALRDELGVHAPVGEDGLMLDWEQIRMMRRHGIAFGSHTETHPILSLQESGRAWEEIVGSKRALEANLQEEVDLFAYPNGRSEDFTQETVAMLRRAGYRAAVTTRFGFNEVGEDAYRWRRGTPWEPDLPRFALKLAYYRVRRDPAAEGTRARDGGPA